MKYIQYVEGIACIGGIAFAILVAVMPRFGAVSRRILLLLFPLCLSAGVQAFGPVLTDQSPERLLLVSFALIILASSVGYSICRALQMKRGRNYAVLPAIIAAIIVVFLFFTAPGLNEINSPDVYSPDLYSPDLYSPDLYSPNLYSWERYSQETHSSADNYVELGTAGYIYAIFLLLISVVVIANIEQMLRHSSESFRWGMKLLLLGIGTIYSTIIYISTRMLLYWERLHAGDIHVAHVLFLIACVLIALSWKRSSGETHTVVSQSAVYSFITLLGVGTYLIISGVFARMIGNRLGAIGFPVEALVFIVAMIGLAVLFFTTGLRNKVRSWIRLNIFAGKYDYRQTWIEASRHIRSIDSQEAAAGALAEIIHKSMGAANISVWVRRWNPNRLQLLSVMGEIASSPGEETFDIVEHLINEEEPLSVKDLERKGYSAEIMEFMKNMRAILLVPMWSSNRIIGLITVGKDSSGRKYGSEGREFLHVLAGHIAGEFHKSDLLATVVSAREDEAFRSFSTFVLHDLKNFASTLSYIAKNAPKHQNNPEFQKDAFQSVYETAEKMKRICNNLRTFSGTLAADKKMYNLNQIVHSVVDALESSLGDNLKLDLAELPLAFVDEEEVARVLQNLILNSREAIAQDGTIFVRTFNCGDKINVVVEDNGSGMSKEFLEKELFVPFHTTKSAGLGIGLFHSKKIMEAHEGNILVESEEGKGTKITLIFPINKT